MIDFISGGYDMEAGKSRTLLHNNRNYCQMQKKQSSKREVLELPPRKDHLYNQLKLLF